MNELYDTSRLKSRSFKATTLNLGNLKAVLKDLKF